MALKDELIKDIIEWDIENWKECLSYWPENSQININDTNILELGSRHGGLSLWAAMSGANVICSDKNGPTDKAKKMHEKYNISKSVQYKEIDALNIPYKNELDVIMSKSILGGIGYNDNISNQKLAISEIYNALRDGGEFWFIENLVASPFHQFMRKRFVRWGNSWRYVSTSEMELFLNKFSAIEYKTLGFLSCFGRNENQRNTLSKFDKFISKITPNDWCYIIIGVARK
ncbi:class I SAM-dependent methyltransferase [Xenorhabdus szentirmaii]|uniref:class I SAM-dependent methyltransferase n=1 Tax=Xenorhabdus szentirmaii TaxID=290112 RepID=UPI0019CC012D|nr:methyltransferase domain-containing protein [Xenorhabdus sp. CUL]MBD2791578.1 class I SAM-dependent methyltransferase [Xenorhabdus sp. CUL]